MTNWAEYTIAAGKQLKLAIERAEEGNPAMAAVHAAEARKAMLDFMVAMLERTQSEGHTA